MESGVGTRMRAANTHPPLSGGFFSPGEALMDARMTTEMKIMIFPVKFDKFTGFFDKFLKTISFIKSNLFQIVALISSSKNRMFFRILS